MKTKIKITDSNGLRKAEVVLSRIKDTPYYLDLPKRMKAYFKVRNAIKHYDEHLIKNQTHSLFTYKPEEPIYECGNERSFASRLNEGFALMGQDD